MGGQTEVNYANTNYGQLVLKRAYYKSLVPTVATVDVHLEEGNTLLASDQYTVQGSTNMSFKTKLKFPVPNVLAQNLSSGHPMLFTLTVEVEAQWPTRGGGFFTGLLFDASSLFASSVITAPSLGRGSLIYKIVAMGTIKTVRALADMFTLTVSWETNSWYEGEDTYGFDVVYSVTALDTELKIGHWEYPDNQSLQQEDVDDACNLAVLFDEGRSSPSVEENSVASEVGSSFSTYSFVCHGEEL